jgi:hypothetical protein
VELVRYSSTERGPSHRKTAEKRGQGERVPRLADEPPHICGEAPPGIGLNRPKGRGEFLNGSWGGRHGPQTAWSRAGRAGVERTGRPGSGSAVLFAYERGHRDRATWAGSVLSFGVRPRRG